MKIRYLTLLTTLVFLGFTVSTFAKGKPGNTDEVPLYRAELIGDFEFLSEGLTTKRKGKSLPGNDKLGVVHNGNVVDGKITGGIFGKDCSALLTESGVQAFEAPDDWGISYTRSRGGPDQVHITMNDLMISPGASDTYSRVDFDLHLHGQIGVDFLPVSGSVSHTLTRYMLWAGGLGEEGWFVCNSTGDGMTTWEELPQAITLMITLE